MQTLKTILILGCCFLLGIGIANGIRKFRSHAADAFETPHIGIGNAPKLRGFAVALTASAPSDIENMRADQLRATAVNLTYPAAGSAGKILAEAAAKAKKRGMQVVLSPQPVFSTGNPYPQPLEAIAREAQAARVDVLCLSWLNTDPDMAYWNREASAVRRAFDGKIILAATPEIAVAIESFDAFDFMGAIGPVRLAQRLPHASDQFDLPAMRVFWGCTINSLESRAQKASRPLMLLHMVVPSTISGRLSPLDLPPSSLTADPELQKLAYEALLVETKGRSYVEGLFMPWSPQHGSSDQAAADPVAVNHFPELVKKVESLWSTATPETAPAATQDEDEKESDGPATSPGDF